MKKALKITGIAAAVVLIVIIGLTLFVKSYLTDERIRSIVTESAESSLNRKVSLGVISVSIFRGISVEDFEVREKDSDAAFVKADAFVLKYQILPLLSRKLIIDELIIESPKIAITRKADGSFNFSDVMRKKEGAGAEEKESASSGLPVALSVQSFRIVGGRIEYDDPAGTVKKAVVGLDLNTAIQGRSRDVIGASGNAKITILELVMKSRPEPVKDISVRAEYRTEANLVKRQLEISEASVNALGLPASIKGTLHYGDPFSYAVAVDAASADLSEVQKAASGFLPKGIGIDGVLSVHLDVEQSPEKDRKLLFNGEMNLDNVSVELKNMKPVFNGTVVLTPERIVFRDMKLLAGDSSADISGRIEKYTAEPDIRIDITSSLLNFDSLIPPTGKGEPGENSGKMKNEEKEFGPLKTKITAEGKVDVARMLIKGVTVRNMKADYTFRDNIFKISSLTGNTLSGSFTAQSTVDLSKKGTVYNVHASTKGIKLEEITAAFAPKAREKIFGSLSASADISGAGSVSESIKRNLKGKGTFSVKDGKISNAEISEGLLSLLGLQSLKEIPMQKAEGSFTIDDGMIDLKSVVASKDLVMDETGTVGLDQKLDMGILVKVSDNLSPEMVRQSGISRFLSEEKGWTAIPLKLSGTISNPSYGVDTQAVGKKATETIQKKVEGEIFKALSGEKDKKKSTEQPQQEGQPAAPEEKKSGSPEDLLKKLFK